MQSLGKRSSRSSMFDEKTCTEWSVCLHRTATQKGAAAGKPQKLPGFQLMSQQRSQLCHTSSSPHRGIISLPIIIQHGKGPAKSFLLQILIKSDFPHSLNKRLVWSWLEVLQGITYSAHTWALAALPPRLLPAVRKGRVTAVLFSGPPSHSLFRKDD